MNEILVGYVFIASAVCFALMGIDKSRAKKKKWRISEKTLFTFAIIGGACGGVVAMILFRHKTRHAPFIFGFPMLAMIQIFFLIYLNK
ncbi:DUF1294 domain-containing protein [Ureibacillus thermophilus]|uniref:DUF1294 domain-containing protein n=1 Tax=Ureibacillus thermophilus TaxID=367743 RepID=UPI00360C02B7